MSGRPIPTNANPSAYTSPSNQKRPPPAVISYLDLLCRDRALFTSFHQQGHLLSRLERRLAPLDQPFASAECVIRPAFLDLTPPQEGFSLSLYLKAVGASMAEAHLHWSAALDAVTAILRTKDLFPQT